MELSFATLKSQVKFEEKLICDWKMIWGIWQIFNRTLGTVKIGALMGFFCRPLNSHGFTVCHTVSLPFSRYHDRFLISHGFTNFERIFSQNYSFLKKQTQAAHSNVNKERMSSMINKNKTSIPVIYLWLRHYLFFLSGFSLTTIHESQDCRGRERVFL